MGFANKPVSMFSGNVKATPWSATIGARPVGSQYRARPQVKAKYSRKSLPRRTLGMTSQMVRGGLTYGSSVVPVSQLARRTPGFSPTQTPVISPAWGSGATSGQYSYSGNPSPGQFPTSQYGGYGGPSQYGGGASNNPSSANNLALLAEQYNSNPSSLSATQWQQLQAAGVIPATSPYSNAAYTSTTASSSSGAIDPATGLPYAQELAAATAASTTASTTTATSTSSIIGTDPTTGATTIFGVDWYWLAGGLVLVYVFTGKRR